MLPLAMAFTAFSIFNILALYHLGTLSFLRVRQIVLRLVVCASYQTNHSIDTIGNEDSSRISDSRCHKENIQLADDVSSDLHQLTE